MQQPKTPPSTRKKFLLWGTAVLAGLAFFKTIPGSKSKKKETVKMLTRDGRLVEIDKHRVVTRGKKASTQELQEWVKK